MARQLELLAPAGNLETLKAVIYAGADAVYAGGSRFGARAYAPNFSRDEMLEAIDFAHLYGRKLYLAVNTLLKERELKEQLYDYLLPYYEHGLDAVIVQDFGVMRFIRRNFKDLPIHASTQMTVLGADGAKFLEQAGASRIVLARELSLEEIGRVHQETGAALEVFVHGALCYCYSGQCLFSSMLGGRSGNRGRCAQPCRLPYSVLPKPETKKGRDPQYPLSPKDLCALGLLPQLVQSGVSSFKIEGRMKQAKYAAGVVSVYRKYVDRLIEGGEAGYSVEEEDRKLLSAFGSRSGFTEGYFLQWNGPDMLAMQNSAHKSCDMPQEPAQKEPKVRLRGRMRMKTGSPSEFTVSYGRVSVSVWGDTAAIAHSRPVTKEELRKRLSKTGNTPFAFETLEIEADENLFLPVSSLNDLRRRALEQFAIQYLSPYRRKAQPKIAAIAKRGCKTPQEPVLLTAQAETKEQLSVLEKSPLLSGIYIDSGVFSREDTVSGLAGACDRAHEAGKQAFYCFPAVFRGHTGVFYASVLPKLKADGFLVRSYDALGFLLGQNIPPEKIRLDYCFSAWSSEAKEAFAQFHITKDTVPAELNRKEILERDNTGSEIIFYGRIPLMVSAQCVQRSVAGCSRIKKERALKDRYGVCFPVKNNCSECYNIIYNSRPACLFSAAGELKAAGIRLFRLSFTTEGKEQVAQALNGASQALDGGEWGYPADGYTYGHYKRGVE